MPLTGLDLQSLTASLEVYQTSMVKHSHLITSLDYRRFARFGLPQSTVGPHGTLLWDLPIQVPSRSSGAKRWKASLAPQPSGQFSGSGHDRDLQNLIRMNINSDIPFRSFRSVLKGQGFPTKGSAKRHTAIVTCMPPHHMRKQTNSLHWFQQGARMWGLVRMNQKR